MRRLLGITVIGLGILLGSAPVRAHHSFAAEFDRDKTITVTGIVQKLEWTNPHARIYVEGKDENGKMQVWDFELDYRLDHCLSTGRVLGAESSLYWRRTDNERWPLSRFSGTLEERGWSRRLTGWILGEACGKARELRRDHPDLSMAVAISPDQLRDSELASRVARALGESGLPPAALELSVAEGVIQDRASDRALRDLSRLGVCLSVSDFGSEASLSRLSELPLGALRIGPQLGDLAGSDERSAARLRAAVGLSQALNLRLSARGVDEARQRDFLVGIGCARGQGNLYAPHRPEQPAGR
jgi:EAL domain-containing protein (putative c-di-GMP-specific phosphodiesterase class I)